MSNKNIIKINSILFFVGWIIILLLGADFPPPIGFLWLVLLVAILDFIQYKYLRVLLPQLKERKKNLFLKNLFFFTVGGVIVALFILITRYNITLEMNMNDIIILIIVITAVSTIYGIFFWVFNLWLLKISKK
jgi:hypothetical protein